MSAGKVCVITGGSSGIGLAAARRMGEKGYALVLAARTPAKLERALKELEKGEPEEIAALFAAVSDPEMGYLTGCDILCDGGCVAGKTSRSYH